MVGARETLDLDTDEGGIIISIPFAYPYPAAALGDDDPSSAAKCERRRRTLWRISPVESGR
jgi:hypothetical protein